MNYIPHISSMDFFVGRHSKLLLIRILRASLEISNEQFCVLGYQQR